MGEHLLRPALALRVHPIPDVGPAIGATQVQRPPVGGRLIQLAVALQVPERPFRELGGFHVLHFAGRWHTLGRRVVGQEDVHPLVAEIVRLIPAGHNLGNRGLVDGKAVLVGGLADFDQRVALATEPVDLALTDHPVHVGPLALIHEQLDGLGRCRHRREGQQFPGSGGLGRLLVRLLGRIVALLEIGIRAREHGCGHEATPWVMR